MFTGLVETTGSISAVQHTSGAVRLTVRAPQLAGRWRTGDSIAVSGVCLTALPSEGADHFAADLAEETVRRTSLARLVSGSVVNLELPTPAGSPLGGHVVQGHVDGVARFISLTQLNPENGNSDWRLTLELSPELADQVVQQGSITVEGISLTVARLHDPDESGAQLLEIAIIPHTYAATNLHTLQPGSVLNIETDVLAKYARKANRQWASVAEEVQQEWLTGEYLMANGY